MAWYDSIWPSDLLVQNYNFVLAAIVILVPSLGFALYRKYSQWNTYESVNENELLKERLAAARLKQQVKYDEFIQENGTTLKELNEQLEKELKNSKGDDKKPKPKGESLLSDHGYFPLMGGGTGTSYKPVKKRACGPCGGGGCG